MENQMEFLPLSQWLIYICHGKTGKGINTWPHEESEQNVLKYAFQKNHSGIHNSNSTFETIYLVNFSYCVKLNRKFHRIQCHKNKTAPQISTEDAYEMRILTNFLTRKCFYYILFRIFHRACLLLNVIKQINYPRFNAWILHIPMVLYQPVVRAE